MIGRKITPGVAGGDAAVPATVIPKPCPTIEGSVPRSTSKRVIESAGRRLTRLFVSNFSDRRRHIHRALRHSAYESDE